MMKTLVRYVYESLRNLYRDFTLKSAIMSIKIVPLTGKLIFILKNDEKKLRSCEDCSRNHDFLKVILKDCVV